MSQRDVQTTYSVQGRRRFSVAVAVLVGLAASLTLPFQTARAGSPAVEGSWEVLPYLMPVNPIHGTILHTGKILIVSGSENDPTNHDNGDFVAAVWDYNTGTFAVQPVLWDIFCTGVAAFPDGRIIIAGGTGDLQPPYGVGRVSMFDPATEKFNEIEEMANARFYASVVMLNDGRAMVFGGIDEDRVHNDNVEMYTIATGWGPELPAPWTPRLYPREHLLPNGDVYFSGVQADSNVYHPSTNTWDLNVAKTVFPQDRQGGTSILLPLRPASNYGAKIMIMGGALNHAPATETAEIIDLSVTKPAWRMVAPMSAPRQRMESCMLPNGLVLAAGGSINDEDNATAVLTGDLFNPVTETWAPGGTFVYPHLYHSILLLRPDGRVVIAGSNPVLGTWEPHIEVYSPPYLFTTDGSGNSIPAVRPTITSATSEIGYGGTLTISTPDSTDIKTVVLTRLCSSTHNIDFDQRLVELNFTQGGTGKLTATAPPNANIAPPGYYLVWILNNAGTPSEGAFVHLTANPSNRPPKGKITQPREDTVIQVGDAVNFTGTATDKDGTVTGYHWVFPGGDPVNSNVQNPGLVTFTTAGTHVVSFTAIDNLGVNDPSPPTVTITIGIGVTYEKPADGSTYNIGAKVPIIVDAAGTTGDENTFTVSVDGTEVGSTTGDVTTASFKWFTRNYTAGPHTISTTVTDETGAMGSKDITVNLQ